MLVRRVIDNSVAVTVAPRSVGNIFNRGERRSFFFGIHLGQQLDENEINGMGID